MKSQNQLTDTVIIGAGLAGLACARRLHAAGRSFLICEAADRVGGRVATDVCEGYRLDRGFQVLLTAYPEARRLLDYDALDLRRFYPGALVRHGGKWHRVADPFRHPIDGNGVYLEDGEILTPKAVVIATEAGGAERLLGRNDPPADSNGVTCLYFTAPSVPVSEPILLLNGEGAGPANNLTVLSVATTAASPRLIPHWPAAPPPGRRFWKTCHECRNSRGGFG